MAVSKKAEGNSATKAVDSGSPYAKLVAGIAAVEAGIELELTRSVKQAASKNWEAAAWMLERRFPKRWARASERGNGADSLDEAFTETLIQEVLKRLDDLAASDAPFARELKNDFEKALQNFNARMVKSLPEEVLRRAKTGKRVQ